MKVHLLRSSEVPGSFIDQVLSVLEQYKGPVEFIREDGRLGWQENELEELDLGDEEYFKKKEVEYLTNESRICFKFNRVFRWPDVFTKTSGYRKNNSIPDDELIVILTEHANENNWFSAGEPGGVMDFFIHTGMWDSYLDCRPLFPVVYELISIPLQISMFGSYAALIKNAHRDSRGCINDFCDNKKDVIMKMRTGDICPECTERIISGNVDPALVSQAFRVVDAVRSGMLFRERYRLTRQPSKLAVRGWNHRIYLADQGDVRVSLSPMEAAVFLLLLKHPEGIKVSYFPDHIEELRWFYNRTSREGAVAAIDARVRAIAENRDNLLSQIFARIRRKFTDLIGNEMADAYVIKGESGAVRMIGLDRGLVEWEEK